jgi:LETM1 and EF-hand domain-containing protein 1, mitochondrial
VLQQQEELIEDEQEQEQKEVDARRAKREADEAEAREAQALLPDSEVHYIHQLYDTAYIHHHEQLQPENVSEEDKTRMTTEQLNELAEALSILSTTSSVLRERRELRALMEENLGAEEVCIIVSTRIYSTLNNFLWKF